jgi:hypothetical protein
VIEKNTVCQPNAQQASIRIALVDMAIEIPRGEHLSQLRHHHRVFSVKDMTAIFSDAVRCEPIAADSDAGVSLDLFHLV